MLILKNVISGASATFAENASFTNVLRRRRRRPVI